MSILCPLSGSSKLVLKETIKVKKIAQLYRKLLKCDISSEISGVETIGFYHCLDSDLKFFYPMMAGSEFLYRQLQRLDWYYLDEKEEYDYVSCHVKHTDELLEVGCGKGVFSQKIEVSSYTGLELSKDAIETASKNRIKIIDESVEEHSHANPEIYDVVCSFQVLEHVANPHSFIDSCIKCLKPGGLLIFSVPSDDSFVGTLSNCILNMPPHHVTRWSDRSLKYIASMFNLKLIEIHHEPLAPFHRNSYAKQLVFKSLENLLGIRRKSVVFDLSLTYRVMSTISMIPAVLIARGLSDERLMPIGHSVTVVYQK